MSTKTIQKNIKIKDIDILVLKKNIKNFHLNVLPPNGTVRISVPIETSNDTIRTFAITRWSWIKKQINSFKDQDRQTDREYVSGESHYLKGDRYLLNVIHHNSQARIEVRNKKHLDFYVPEGHTVTQKEKVVMDRYRNELKKEIQPLIEKREKIIGVTVDKWNVRRMKTVWGTSNADKRDIRLNLELAKKPLQYLEYIIVHEMVHFLERTHNKRFEKYMDTYLPKWKLYRRELNDFIL